MGCLARRLRHLIAEDAQKGGAVVNSDQACRTVQCAPLRPQVSETADLPVQFPTKFEVGVDFKTAKALCAAIDPAARFFCRGELAFCCDGWAPVPYYVS
jgi:hypothetical protein